MKSVGPKRQNEAGLSLTETLVASLFLLVFLASASSYFSAYSKSLKSLEQKTEVSEIRKTLAEMIDCQKTFDLGAIAGYNYGTCNSTGRLVPLYASTGGILVSANETNPTVMGQWTLRAVCTPTGTYVDFARPKLGIPKPLSSARQEDFFQEPTLKIPLSWTRWGARVTSVPTCRPHVPSAPPIPPTARVATHTSLPAYLSYGAQCASDSYMSGIRSMSSYGCGGYSGAAFCGFWLVFNCTQFQN